MEKISGIIPRNARNSSVDLSKSQPVRPGAPSFGRPIGKVTPRTFSDAPATKEVEVSKDTFFLDNKKMAVLPSEENPVEDKVTLSANIKELKNLQAETDEIEAEVISRNDINQKDQTEVNTKKNVSQYNKKGEVVKAAIAEEVSKNFNNLEV